jgi:hypothetical protein
MEIAKVKKTHEKFTLPTEIIRCQLALFHIIFNNIVKVQRVEAKLFVIIYTNNSIRLKEGVIEVTKMMRNCKKYTLPTEILSFQICSTEHNF